MEKGDQESAEGFNFYRSLWVVDRSPDFCTEADGVGYPQHQQSVVRNNLVRTFHYYDRHAASVRERIFPEMPSKREWKNTAEDEKNVRNVTDSGTAGIRWL